MTIATEYIARAVEVTGTAGAPTQGRWWAAEFATPGMDITRASEAGKVLAFPDPEDAEAEAGKRLVVALNNRAAASHSRRPFTYRRLTGAQLAVALRAAGLAPTEFAHLYGTSQERVMKWIEDAEDIPHPVTILLHLFAIAPQTLAAARAKTGDMADRKERRRA